MTHCVCVCFIFFISSAGSIRDRGEDEQAMQSCQFSDKVVATTMTRKKLDCLANCPNACVPDPEDPENEIRCVSCQEVLKAEDPEEEMRWNSEISYHFTDLFKQSISDDHKTMEQLTHILQSDWKCPNLHVTCFCTAEMWDDNNPAQQPTTKCPGATLLLPNKDPRYGHLWPQCVPPCEPSCTVKEADDAAAAFAQVPEAQVPEAQVAGAVTSASLLEDVPAAHAKKDQA
mmetsp:Transcript_41991/g.74258  ORF Transcript_41991/g.74258 Transcript_41991/m.74258 type:complete len:230 (-) Transcript_41991:194-883(-)